MHRTLSQLPHGMCMWDDGQRPDRLKNWTINRPFESDASVQKDRGNLMVQAKIWKKILKSPTFSCVALFVAFLNTSRSFWSLRYLLYAMGSNIDCDMGSHSFQDLQYQIN